MKLTLHEGIGRFSLAGLVPSSGASFTPLLVAQDPRSSMVSLLVSDRVIRLGESFDFLETVEKTATGARFTWTSKQLVVTETFSFIGAPGEDAASGVRVDLQVANVSDRDVSVAVRYLFDTWLGEASSLHFRTDTVEGLTRELTVTKDERPAYWVSPLPDAAWEKGPSWSWATRTTAGSALPVPLITTTSAPAPGSRRPRRGWVSPAPRARPGSTPSNTCRCSACRCRCRRRCICRQRRRRMRPRRPWRCLPETAT